MEWRDGEVEEWGLKLARNMLIAVMLAGKTGVDLIWPCMELWGCVSFDGG